MQPQKYVTPQHETRLPQAEPSQAEPKKAWHRPTLTFVSLQATAAGGGSFGDGETLTAFEDSNQ